MKTIIKKRDNFTTVHNNLILDEKISWKAKGILLYMLSRPDGWKYNIKEISKNSKDGTDSVSKGIQELVKEKYVSRKKNPDGSVNYYIFEDKTQNDMTDSIMDFKNPEQENPEQENPEQENPEQENPEQDFRLYNKERNTLKTEYNKKDINKYIYDSWNGLAKKNGLAEIRSVTTKREKKIETLLKKYSFEEIMEAMNKIKESDFLLGKTTDWQISFDDFVEERKFIKLLEDGYRNKNQKKIIASGDDLLVTEESLAETFGRYK